MDDHAALRLRDVVVRRHGHDGAPLLLLDRVDWTVRAGEQWVVLGPNGAGKSTLLRLAAGGMQPSSGSVHVLGARVGRVDLRDLRERIGIVDAATARALRPSLTGHEVALTGIFGSVALQRRRLRPVHDERVRRALRLVGAESLADRRFEDASQGERQRLLLARALVGRGGDGPELLLLDEPAAGLDLPSRERLVGALAVSAAARPDLPTVTVTHHLEEIPPTTTHALLLRAGRVVDAGPVAATLRSDPVGACFGLPVDVARTSGRWRAQVSVDAWHLLDGAG
ncbi:MAG: ATP-binding cassette domain-containing protein [Solirubrobacteraceae bacterium]|nr:ATP-binding cassette domain-containing protein [Solirubrobacteraceae bacterium]